ncbi:hypothetical protein BKA67DRAFT_508962, partial [Truncatella angustata]
ISQYIVLNRPWTTAPSDDILMIIILATYTIAVTSLYIYEGIITNTNFEELTEEQKVFYGRQLGILNILAETAIQTTLWGNKCCFLILYHRLAIFLHQGAILNIVSGYIVASYVAVIVALFGGWCRPFSQYLVLQPDVDACLTWRNYNILQMGLNLTTDAMCIIIPTTSFIRLQLNALKKLFLICLSSLGIFVMIAAIMMKYNVFINPMEPVWFPWCIREVSTATIVSNIPLCVPVLQNGLKLLGNLVRRFSTWTIRGTGNRFVYRSV